MNITSFKEFKPMRNIYWGAIGVQGVTTNLQLINNASAQTGISSCDGSPQCWGFVYCYNDGPDDNDVWIRTLKTNSECAVYFSDSRVPRNYHEFVNHDFIFNDTHTYNVPLESCAYACDNDDTCLGFDYCGDTCRLMTLVPLHGCSAYFK